MIRGYLKFREEKEISCSTRALDLAAIESFFKANGLELNMDSKDRPAGCGFGSKVPTHDEIRNLVEASEDIRLKALILFLKDSGLRLSDVKKLRWEDLKDHGDGFYGMRIMTEKQNTQARPFIGPECSKILMLCKRKREIGTEKLPPESNIKEHPLFAKISEPDKPMNIEHMSISFNDLTKLLGYDSLSAHGLRKFWEQNFHTEHPGIKKQFNGRTLSGDEKAYQTRTDEQLFEIYKHNYDELKIYRFEIGKAYLAPDEFKEAMGKFLQTEDGKQFLVQAIKDTIVPSEVTNEILRSIFKPKEEKQK